MGEIRTIAVPVEPYPQDTPRERLDRLDTFVSPEGRYHGECMLRPDDLDAMPEGFRAVLAVSHEVEGFKYRIFRAATLDEAKVQIW